IERQEGTGREGRDRADREGAAPARRHLHPLRSQRGRPDQRPGRADRHARVRARRPRAARAEVHEDYFAGARGALEKLSAISCRLSARAESREPKALKNMSRLATPIRKNDNVLVITGKDRGKRGRVLKVVPGDPGRTRLIVEGVNMIKRHTKPNP